MVQCTTAESADEAVGRKLQWRESLDAKHHQECLEAVESIFASATIGSQDLIIFNFFALVG